MAQPADQVTLPECPIADGYDSPVGTAEERASDTVWPGRWHDDINSYLTPGLLGYHTGSDLNLPGDADKGAPVYSIASGVVVYAGKAYNRDGSSSGFGNMVIIRHDPMGTCDGRVMYSRYAHIKGIIVDVGEVVGRGTMIGQIWNSGTVAHHLHFDLSQTDVLSQRPTHWPGNHKDEVLKHYVDPRQFIADHRPSYAPLPTLTPYPTFTPTPG